MKKDTSKKGEKGPELMITLAEYQKSREHVIISLSNVQTGLQHVQQGLNDLLSAYIKHTSSVLAGEDAGLDNLQLPESVAETANAAMAAASFAVSNVAQSVATVPSAAAPTAPPAAAPPATGKNSKRKREKKYRDPNAPKRPLTAAFLYAQAARPVVKKDLEAELQEGQKLEPNAVNIEINKRWNESTQEDKDHWKASYRESREKYNEEFAAYKAAQGDAVPAELQEEDASDEAEAVTLDSEADSESEDEAAVEASPINKAPSPPATTGKTPRPNKRQKTANGASAPVAIAPTPVPVPRQGTQIKPPASSTEGPTATPAKKDKKKKVVPPVAPALEKEASPDDKRKIKNGRSTRNTEPAEESPEKENKPVAKKRDRTKRKSEAGTS